MAETQQDLFEQLSDALAARVRGTGLEKYTGNQLELRFPAARPTTGDERHRSSAAHHRPRN
jgi:hypothetical protein